MADKSSQEQAAAGETQIDGGEVSEQAGPPVGAGPPKDPEKYRATITNLLLALLATTIIGHYLGVLVLEWNGKKTEALTGAYHEALPVVSGLVVSAVTYYFTRELKK